MIRRKVVLRLRAQKDLDEIAQWIADEASVDVAVNYVRRVEDYISRLDVGSHRGTLRNEIRPGLRTVGFEGRLTIAFLVEETTVSVVRIFRAGRNWSEAFD
ncbi:type II toxin-antitoxin system RelE/ParE family toxin [Phenylobacterium sp.]|uniref:type II toxin-antitoxin system RelE/ParE family toxin n=1 Tax=Phenylobacterium sp. TaxID=1871053 RepID=UPI0025FC8F96|nr:type II toxin-antitoxin system RelE/ParE family toxin [Phenylobacterium sp.]MBX3485349.1 type II toxin-antitoxin system RelE/ParE family toxin [Phenylobacterium sp.]